MPDWTITGGSAAAGSSNVGTPPPDVTLGTPTVVYLPPDQQGKIKARITIPFTAPNPRGTWDHVWGELHAPDDYATQTSTITGNIPPANGLGMYVGPANIASTVVPPAKGIEFGPFTASQGSITVEYQSPSVRQQWRIYAPSGSTTVENPTVPGTTPSVVVTVDPAPSLAIGAEYAPNASNFSVTLTYGTDDGGNSVWQFAASWNNPTGDPRYAQLGGYDLTLQGSDGTLENPLASPSRTDTSYTSRFRAVPATPTVFTFRLVAWDVNSRKNTVVTGVTPAVYAVIQRPAGAAGKEYTTLVASFTASVVYERNTKDGTERWYVTFTWLPPTDNTYGGMQPILFWSGDTHPVPLGAPSGPTDTVFKCGPLPMGATNTATVYAVSYDRSNRQNTIKAGTTPSVTFTVSPQFAGILASGLDPSTLAGTLAINSSLLGVAPHSISDTQVTPGGISTPSLTTNEIAIGGGGSKPIRFRVYDHSGNPIAWIGDDTLNSGYVGAWFQQLYVGGTGPAGAPFSVNASGQLSIVMTAANAGATPFQLTLNSAITSITNSVDGVTSNTAGLKVQDSSGGARNNYYSSVQAGYFYLVGYNTGMNPGGFYALAQIDILGSGTAPYGYLALTDGATGNILDMDPHFMRLKMNGNQIIGTRKTDPGAPSFATIADVQTWCANLRNALAWATGGHGLF